MTPQPRIAEAGWRAYREGRLAEALSIYQEAATSSSPQDASLWHDVGCLRALTRDFAGAREALERALALDPALAAAHDALGQLEEQDSQREAARTQYLRAVEREPGNAKFLRHATRILLQLNELDHARQTLEALLTAAPDDTDARNQLGIVELWLDMPDLAHHHFQQALRVRPSDVTAWNGLAVASTHIGALEEAREAAEQARQLQPKDASTLTNLGLVAAYEGRWEEARQAWQAALALDAQCVPAAKNLEALNSLEPPASP